MRATKIFRDLSGYLWELIKDISPDDFLEPGDPVRPSEQVLGPMTDFEKALFSIHEDIFETILTSFDKDSDTDEEVIVFYDFLLNCSKEDFLKKCVELVVDVEEVLHLRSQLILSYDFLHLVTMQRFDLNFDDFSLFYRQGFLITIQNKNVFHVNPN
jgi:hypothetical protein